MGLMVGFSKYDQTWCLLSIFKPVRRYSYLSNYKLLQQAEIEFNEAAFGGHDFPCIVFYNR